MDINTGDSWVQRAACVGRDDVNFFLDDDTDGGYGPALALCRTCVVVEPCLAAAVGRREQFGVWGGTTPSQRKKLFPRVRRRRGEAVA